VVPVPFGEVVAPVPLEGWEREAALVITTSGSTGVPKSVLLSAAALRASADATHARLGGPGRWLLALPATHIAGVQVLVRSLVAGTSPAVLDLAPGFRAEAFADAARPLLASSGPHYTALVPTQLARLLAEDVAVLKEFDGVLLGGAATPQPLLEAALEAGVRVVTTYGMSETAGGCVYDGVPLDGVEVRLVDGRVSLAGPMVALGYRGQRFGDGWFRTGDLGRFRVDGTLEVLGRADDVIVTGGEKVAPVLVERALAAVPGVREVCVVGVPDVEWGQVVVAAVVVAGAPVAEGLLRDAVRAAAGRAAVPKRVLFLPELPTRGPGKVDRAAVARSFG
jgi:O-succinylbenzoic acid--CoA ligase